MKVEPFTPRVALSSSLPLTQRRVQLHGGRVSAGRRVCGHERVHLLQSVPQLVVGVRGRQLQLSDEAVHLAGRQAGGRARGMEGWGITSWGVGGPGEKERD